VNRVLLIGSNGYIGSALQEHFLKVGIQFQGIDTKNSQAHPVNSNSKDFGLLTKREVREFSHVVLLAAHSSVQMCSADPVGAITNNLANLENLLNIITESQTFVFASTGSVYDGVQGKQATEDTPLSTPRNIYDFTKRAGEDLIRMHKARSIIFRFGTVSGPSPHMRKDVVINRMVSDALANGYLTISNAHVHRAILSIDDLCEGISLSMTNIQSIDTPLVFNLSSFNSTVKNLGSTIAKATGATIKEGISGSTYDFSMSNTKASKFFGFMPQDNIDNIINKLMKKYQ